MYLLIIRKGSPQSDKALVSVENALSEVQDIRVLLADVNLVRDIHPVYNIESVPVLLEFEKTFLKNLIKGAHDSGFYQSIFEKAGFFAKAEKEGKPLKNVTLYTTPTCSWCNTLKSYLRQHLVRYTEIDVSKNESAAREMQNRSGQQGVPQTVINGEIVVGFDRPKINRLLGIEG